MAGYSKMINNIITNFSKLASKLYNMIKHIIALLATIIIIIWLYLLLLFIIKEEYNTNARCYETIYKITSVVELSAFWYNIISITISSLALVGVFFSYIYQNRQLIQMRMEHKNEVQNNRLNIFFVMYSNWRKKAVDMRINTHLYKMGSCNVVNLKKQSFVVNNEQFADLVEQFLKENLDKNDISNEDVKSLADSFVDSDYINYLNLLYYLIEYANSDNIDRDNRKLMNDILLNSPGGAERYLLSIFFERLDIINESPSEMKQRLKVIGKFYELNCNNFNTLSDG